jgi:hypothetical protein
MSSSVGSESYIAFVAQDPATPRTIPNSPTLQKVNFTEDSLETNVSTKMSEHIRDDRMIADVNRTGISIGGGYSFEFQFANSGITDPMILAALCCEEWSSIHSVPGSVSIVGAVATASGSTLDLTTGAVVPDNIQDGQTIRLSGSSSNDGFYTLIESETQNIYITTPSLSSDETFGAGVTIDGEMARNGKHYQPFFIERGHTDIDEYFQFMGMALNIMTLEMTDQSDVMGSFDFVGIDSDIKQTAEGSSYVDVPSTNVFSTSIDVAQFSINNTVQESCVVKEMDLQIDNKITPKTGLGVFGACETKAHTISISGNLSAYFESSAMYNRLLNGTAFSVSFVMMDSSGNGYRFTLPRLKLDTDKINVTGKDDDVMDETSYVATADPVTGCAIQVDRFKAL